MDNTLGLKDEPYADMYDQRTHLFLWRLEMQTNGRDWRKVEADNIVDLESPYGYSYSRYIESLLAKQRWLDDDTWDAWLKARSK